MKRKSLITPLFALAFGVSISTNAGAALLFGFTSFTSDSLTENADVVFTNFSATLNKAGVASSNVGGSSDGAYGPALGTGGSGGNGFVTLSTSASPFITLTNNTSNPYALEFLLFDTIRNASSTNGVITVNYINNGGPTTPVYNDELLGIPVYSNSYVGIANNVDNAPLTPGIDADYSDRMGNLSGIILGVGNSVSFYFSTLSNDMRLDNIAVTGSIYTPPPSGIPEPANFAALGGLLISGLAIRSRRRSVKA